MFGKQHSKEYVDGYRDGFHDGADCKQNFKLHMLGYEVGELLKIIQEHELNSYGTADELKKAQMKINKEHKLMTKAEANKICKDKGWGDLAEVLEALGLIEFKEEYASSAEMAVREKFRQALADAGHPEATVYGHWALSAYDIAHK